MTGSYGKAVKRGELVATRKPPFNWVAAVKVLRHQFKILRELINVHAIAAVPTVELLMSFAAASVDYREPRSYPPLSRHRPWGVPIHWRRITRRRSSPIASSREEGGFGGKEGGGGETWMVPRGGGVAAFRANAARMPGAADEDHDGVDLRSRCGPTRWTRFKIILYIGNTLLSMYSLLALSFTHFCTLPDAAILLVANPTELALSTLAASVTLGTALLGWPGISLDNCTFAVGIGLFVVPGYLPYTWRTLNLGGKTPGRIYEPGAAAQIVVSTSSSKAGRQLALGALGAPEVSV
ncbi:hypothetical protein C8R47DRAFT_1189450 [Mycena vitilis]|nr:hypothetical protein C8R47DRAFT_1189450 [Mycena vitilis]